MRCVRNYAFAIAATAALFSSLLTHSSASAGQFIAGDLAPRGSPDGQIDAADLLLLQRMIINAIGPTPLERLVGDVAPLGNPDGELNAGDMVVLLRAVTGQIVLPPIIDDEAPSPANADLISVLQADAESISVTGAAGSVEAGTTVALVNFETGATAVAEAENDGSFSVFLAAHPGEVFGITLTDPAGNASPSVSMGTGIALTIEIASPSESSVIHDDHVTVRGTYTGPPGTAVTVNGVTACVDGSSYFASDVPLLVGDNVVTVTATTQDELTVTDSVVLISDGAPSVSARMSQECGPAPHTVSVRIDSQTIDVQSVDIDFDGDGNPDVIGGSPGIEHSFTYAGPGVFDASVWVLDSVGGVYYSRHSVQAQDLGTTDGLLRDVYGRMLDRLRVGAIEGALNSVASSARDRYRLVFDALAPNLDTIVDQMGSLGQGIIGADYAEYLLVRTPGPGGRAYLIYFIRGDDGVWRIAEM